ncbi:MAG: PEGA domain-containing protein [Deltaproteobacteria bacterium]|nr:PEGA domain-containing protein [Deltaproteobacteria bacterium]MBW1872396.1 PEGA domain-containing protein [Deltaproteobacteria bacterium]
MKLAIQLCLLLMVAGLAPNVHAQDKPLLAVFDIENRGPRLTKQAVENLSEYMSVLLTENGYQVVSQAEIRQKIRAKKSHAELAREIKAQHYLDTRILRIINVCKVTAKLYNIESSIAIQAASAGDGCNEKELLSALKQVVFKLSYNRPNEAEPEDTTLYYYKSGGLEKAGQPISAKTAEATDQAEIGRLSLSSRPWGRVWIDGKDTGRTTPLIDYLLPTGKHHIQILPPKSSAMRAMVEIWPGELTSLVVGSDDENDGSIKTGWLSVNTRPWSEVCLDGKHIGMTPLRHQLAPGQHTVKLTFANGESKSQTVKIAPGQTTRVVQSASSASAVKYGKNMGLLMLNSLPWGRVWIDGKDCGKATPLFDYQLSAGKHRITVYFSTGGLKTEELVIKAGETIRRVFRSK